MANRERSIPVFWIGLLALVLLVQAVPSHGGTRQFDPARAIQSFDLPGLDGKRHTLKDYSGGPLFISIWATWCAPCKEELPRFEAARNALAESYPEAAFTTVNVGDGGARAASFMRRYGLELPVLLAGQNFIYDYNIVTVPTLMVLNENGHLAILHEGWSSATDLTDVLRQDLEILAKRKKEAN